MRKFVIFGLAVIGVFFIDQGIKDMFEAGFNWQSSCISLELHYNHGVAFSMFRQLGEALKWVQIALVALLAYFVVREGWLTRYPLSVAFVAGGALGNIFDRFTKEGVVDYVAWHCGFNFAIFNFADVMIDLGVALIILQEFLRMSSKKQ